MAGPALPQARIVAELQRVAQLPGGAPLSVAFYDAHRGEDSLGSARLVQRFGSWREACGAAEVACHAAPRSYATAWTEDALLAWVRRFLDDGPASPSYAAFTAWLKDHRADGAPSAQTVRNRFGGWSAAVERAGRGA